jgi:outer membrane protein TolC
MLPQSGSTSLRRRFVSLLIGVVLLSNSISARSQSAAQNGTIDLTLTDFLQNVLERNESIQTRLLELEVNRRQHLATRGIFEPEFVGSASREANKRENDVVQQRSTFSDIFDERNNIYQGGIEALVPTGARVRLGYTLRDLSNNLQTQDNFLFRGATNGEFESFFGITITQPLLKNAWSPATLANIRLAAISSDIAFQDYRRQTMLIISTAEAAYWNLYMGQEQVRFFRESVSTAERILNDSRDRVKAGRSSELEVLEAESGLALRRSKLSEAEEKLYEAANRVLSLYSQTVLSTNRLIRAVDQPKTDEEPPSFFDAWKAAYESNPDYLIQRRKAVQEAVRVGYAKNQRLPEVDLHGSYGKNGLADSPGASWNDIERQDFPSWSIGIEFHIPLGGGVKGANELAAALLRRKEAAVAVREVETQIVNGLDTAMHKIRSTRESVRSYQTAVSFNQHLLDSALARLEFGLIESRKVLDIESDLFETKNSLVDALVQYRRALLELGLMEGSILERRNLELSQKELEANTARIVRSGTLTDEQYHEVLRELKAEYEWNHRRLMPTPGPALDKARQLLREKIRELAPTPQVPSGAEAPPRSPKSDTEEKATL